ncbi:hypothetical protein KC887_05555 [Candidatus Kaiserbacteria bacterium]|nr:hypothetical protein [Candidatus Kaiserbacteria bacterium]
MPTLYTSIGSSRRGLNRNGFRFLNTPSLPDKLDEAAMNSLLGKHFLSVSEVARVWKLPDTVPDIPESMLETVRLGDETFRENTFLFYDTGVTVREMRQRFGEEAFDEEFDQLCDQTLFWDTSREAGWQLIEGTGRGLRSSSNDLGCIAYAAHMFYLLKNVTLTRAYWRRTNSGIAVHHEENGVLQGGVITD